MRRIVRLATLLMASSPLALVVMTLMTMGCDRSREVEASDRKSVV